MTAYAMQNFQEKNSPLKGTGKGYLTKCKQTVTHYHCCFSLLLVQILNYTVNTTKKKKSPMYKCKRREHFLLSQSSLQHFYKSTLQVENFLYIISIVPKPD